MDTNLPIGSILTTTDEQFFSLYEKIYPEPKPLFERLRSQYEFLRECRGLRDSASCDAAKLEMWEVTSKKLVGDLKSLLQKAKKSSGEYIEKTYIDGIFIQIKMTGENTKCWLCDHQEMKTHHFKLLNILNHSEVDFVEMNLHLIEAHDQFDIWNVGKEFNHTSINPKDICKIFKKSISSSASNSEDSGSDSSSLSDISSESGNILRETKEDVEFSFVHPGYTQSKEEFLKTHYLRKEMAENDSKVLKSFNVTHKELFKKLNNIIHGVDEQFIVTMENFSKICTACIFCTHVEKTNCSYVIENMDTRQTMKFGKFALHMLDQHQYFATPEAGEYRIDPQITCEVLGFTKN